MIITRNFVWALHMLAYGTRAKRHREFQIHALELFVVLSTAVVCAANPERTDRLEDFLQFSNKIKKDCLVQYRCVLNVFDQCVYVHCTIQNVLKRKFYHKSWSLLKYLNKNTFVKKTSLQVQGMLVICDASLVLEMNIL